MAPYERWQAIPADIPTQGVKATLSVAPTTAHTIPPSTFSIFPTSNVFIIAPINLIIDYFVVLHKEKHSQRKGTPATFLLLFQGILSTILQLRRENQEKLIANLFVLSLICSVFSSYELKFPAI